MQCPKCGADIPKGQDFCDYCGTTVGAKQVLEERQIELEQKKVALQEKQIALEERNIVHQTNKAGCPRCGSGNISFNREKQAELKGKKGTEFVRSTIGYCKDCGYTWRAAEPPKPRKRKTWLWVLGWIFCFPIPLTIIIAKSGLKAVWKVVLISLLWLFFVIIAASGGSGDTSAKKAVDKSVVSTETNEEETKAEAEPVEEASSEPEPVAEPTAASADVTVDETVLLDKDGLKITVTGFDERGSFFGPELKLLIENDSDTGVTVQARNTSVNGYMVDTSISEEVAPGKKSNAGLSIMNSSLEECGITTIADMEFSFHIFTTDGWDTVLDTEMYQIYTSAHDGYQYIFDDSGDEIYNESGIRIVAKGISEKDSIFGPGLVLFIESEYQESITVQARDVSVNGFMTDSTMSEEVSPGKKAITALTFFDSSLEENGITDITNIETSFHIFTTDGWDTIVDTDTIKLTY